MGPIELGFEVASDEGFSTILQSGIVVARPELAHAVHVDVTGLEPARWYFYRFFAGDVQSPVGRTKTAPALGSAPEAVRFAMASCQDWEDGYFAAFQHLANEDLELVVHLGDYIYEGGITDSDEKARQHNGPEVQSLADYRNRYGLYKSDPNLQAAHAAFPWMVTWDDHEFVNDYAGMAMAGGEPEALVAERRAAAFQAYYEHMPLRPESMPLGPTLTLYRRVPFGTLIDFSVLDSRQYRVDHPCGEDTQVRCAAAYDPNATMLGPQQEQWLLAGLDASAARWNVIAQQIIMAELDVEPGPGELFRVDKWDGYATARNRILSHLASREIENPVVLTGDIHSSWVNDLKLDFADPESATVGTEFVGTSISSTHANEELYLNALADNPHVKFYEGEHRGYVTFEVTADEWRADLRVVENALEPESDISTLASFVVLAGQPGAVPA